MKNSELNTLSIEELNQRLLSEKEILQKQKFAHAISPIENPMKIKETRRTIARILTLLNTKETVDNK
ncbi:MAG: 50S ribosomal protein L29 [Cyclobacteriaceae bacterium]|nr:50S ribosomal protein L29 [Cyclobacteriaceae bacterium]MCK5281444.1 50S ribosomal protein L29 [Cyclobacteriaceae bacterium]